MPIQDTQSKKEDELIPSFSKEGPKVMGEDVNRSETIVQALIDFEEIVVPKMMEKGFMNQIAKSMSKPFYNDSNQSMMAHILPGVEILADITEESDNLSDDDLRSLSALWIVHDLHKIITTDNGKEFDIKLEQIEDWVESLSLMEYTDNSLTIKDFHSCAVGLHNQGETNIDDSTTVFTSYRPYLRTVDAIMSISSPEEFVEFSERDINTAFGNHAEVYLPAAHTVDISDSITQTLVNKSLKEEMVSHGLKPIDIRDNGVLYARSETITYPDYETLLNNTVDRFLENLRDGYPIFRNKAYLGGDINSTDSRTGFGTMPSSYDISDLAKLCLNQTELIQRIVQASVEQQNRPWDISNESQSQIESISNLTGLKIPKSSFIEGMGALVHTVYREIVPELVNENSEKPHERTMEGAIIHIFNLSEEAQDAYIKALKSNALNTSPINWPAKYIVAHDLYNRYTVRKSGKERQRELISLITTQLNYFQKWNDYGSENKKKIKRELYLHFAKSISIDGEPVIENPSTKTLSKMSECGSVESCYISGEKTEQNPSSPDLLSHRDIDVLNVPFITKNKQNEFDEIKLDNVVPVKPLSVLSQISLNVRAQQFKNYDDTSGLHVTIHPTDSISVASYLRFKKILQYFKTELFSGKDSSVGLNNMAGEYEQIISKSLEQDSGIDSLVNREQAFDVGMKMDEASSRLALPNDSEESIVRGVMCVTLASLLSGVRVCVTRKPQLDMNHHKTTDLVMYGPELSEFTDLLENRTDLTSLPERLEIIERLLKLSDKTDSAIDTISYYSNLNDRTVLPGSRVLGHMQYNVDNKEKINSASRDAINIDSISAKEDVFAQDIVSESQKLGEKLGNVLSESNPMIAHSVMNITCDTLYTMESINTTEEVIEYIIDDLVNMTELELTIPDVRKGGSVHKFAKQLAETHNRIGSSREQFESIRSPLINGTVVRAMLYAENKGVKK